MGGPLQLLFFFAIAIWSFTQKCLNNAEMPWNNTTFWHKGHFLSNFTKESIWLPDADLFWIILCGNWNSHSKWQFSTMCAMILGFWDMHLGVHHHYAFIFKDLQA